MMRISWKIQPLAFLILYICSQTISFQSFSSGRQCYKISTFIRNSARNLQECSEETQILNQKQKAERNGIKVKNKRVTRGERSNQKRKYNSALEADKAEIAPKSPIIDDDWEGTVASWEEFLRNEYNPSITTVEKILERCNKAQQWQMSLKISSEWQKICDLRSDTFYLQALRPIRILGQNQSEPLNELLHDIMRLDFKGSLQLYNQLMVLFQIQGDANITTSIFKRMLAEGTQPDYTSYISMMNVWSQVKQSQKSLFYFNDMKARLMGIPNQEAYNAAILAFARGSLLDDLETLRAEAAQHGQVIRHNILYHCIKAFYNKKKPSEAYDCMNYMKSQNYTLSPAIYNFVITSQARFGNLTIAEHLYKEMLDQNMFPTCYTYVHLLQGVTKEKRYGTALKYYNDAMSSSELNPSPLFFKKGLIIHAQLGNATGATEVQKQMECAGFHMDIGCYNCMMKAHGISANHSAVLEYFSQMKNDTLVPNQQSYSIAIHSCTEAQNVEECEKLITEMKASNISVDELVLSNMVRLHASNKSFVKAEYYFKQLRDKKHEMRGMGLMIACNKLVQEYRQAGKLDTAATLVKSLKNDGIFLQPPAFIKLVKAFIDKRLPFEAEQLITAVGLEVWEENVQLALYNHLAGGFSLVGDIENANRIMKTMKQQGLAPDSITFVRLIEGSILRKDFDRTNTLLQSMKDLHLDRAFAYKKILYQCINGNCLDKADDYIEEMILEGFLPDIAILKAFVNQCVILSEDWKRGYKWLLILREVGITMDSKVYNLIIAAALASGNVHAAEFLLSEMREDGIEPDIYTIWSLIKAYLQESNVQLIKALKLFKLGRQYGLAFDSKSYTLLICAVVEQQEYEYAEILYNDMILQNLLPERIAIGNIMKAMNQQKHWEETIKYFESALQIGIIPNMIMFNVVILACVESKNFQKARNFFERLEGLSLAPNLITYSSYMKGLIQNSEWIEAVQKILPEMKINRITKDLQFYNILFDSLVETAQDSSNHNENCTL